MTLLCRIQHSENKQKYILFWAFALLFFCIAVSTPILQAGFFGDDIWDSTMKGRMLLNQQGMWETVGVNIKTWLAEGRFFPLNVLSTTALFYFAPHAEMYQIIRVILIWLSLLSFAYLASIIANNRNVGLLFLFCVPLSWSIRISTEPLTTYAFFMPLLTFFIAATLGSYIQFQKTAKQAWLDAAFFMYLCALTTYELGVITFLLLIILAIQKPVEKKCLWPFFIVTLMYVLMNFKLQLVSTAIYPGVEIGALTKFWSAFVAQLSATFPLSYCLSLQHVKLSEVVSKYFVQPAHVAFITSLFLISLSCIFVLLKKIILPKNARLCFFYLGLGLIVLPAALIGINHKYQTIVSLGRGYIPVYLQYCGLAFIIIALIAWLNNTKFSRNRTLILYSFIAVSFSSLISLSVIFNTRSVDMMNIMVETNNRFLLENALAHELLAKVPNEANLVERFRIWNTKEFYMLNAHKKFKAIYLVDGFEKLPVSMSANTFFIDSKNLAGSRDGYVIIGNFIRQKEIKNPLIFIATDNPDHLNKVVSNLQQKLNLSPLEVASILASYAKSSHQKEFLYSLPAATYLFS